MKNERMIRIILGIKSIRQDKCKMIFPVMYICAIYLIWKIGKRHIPIFSYLSLPQLFEWLFGIFLIEMAVIGLLIIFMLMGTTAKAKKAEQALYEIGVVDSMGKAPILLSKKNDKNGMILEFYSPRLPFYVYERQRAEIETAMNIKVISVEVGKDMQHVNIKAINSDTSVSQMILWDDSHLNTNDFVIKLGESYFGDESIDLNSIPHLLIGGASGSGKSKLLKLILMQSIKKGAVIYLADFKGGVDYTKVWHDKCSIIIEAEKWAE